MNKDIILVTGGAGYIGSVLVHQLLEKGKKVRVFDKLYFGPEPLADVSGQIELIAGDVRQFPESVLEGVSTVMHLGSLSNDPTAAFDPKANQEINYDGTMRVAEACLKHKIQRMTFAGSCAVIGFHVDEIADESFPPNPQSEYAESKLFAERDLMKMASPTFAPVSLRQATVYGFSPRMRWDLVINTMTRDAFRSRELKVFHGGDMWRPLVAVGDMARAHIVASEAPIESIRGQVFNVVEENYKILDLAHRVRELLAEKGITVAVRVDTTGEEKRSYKVSGEKIRKVLGFKTQTTIRDEVFKIWSHLESGEFNDFDNPKYYNIAWMKLLADMEKRLAVIGKVF